MATPVLGEWIQFDLGTAKVIQTYGLGNWGSDKEIGSWTLAGSADSSTWYTIDTQTQVTPAHYSFSTYTSAGAGAAGSFRYVRLIVQGLKQQPYFYGSTLQFTFYLQDSAGNFLQTSPSDTATFSQNLGNTTGYFHMSSSTGDVYPNSPGAGPSGPGYYYGTNNTYTGSVSTSITSGAPGGGGGGGASTTDVHGSWFQMDFGSEKTMTSYGMLTDNPPYAPTSWTMTGSNNTTTWYEIDTRSGLSWSGYSQQNFTPAANFAGTSYRYYRWIIKSIATNSIITPSIFFASDSSGYIGWVGRGSCDISSDLTNGHTPNWTMNDAGNGYNNFFMAGSYPSGTYSGSVSTTVTTSSSGGPPPPTTTNALGETASFDLGSAHQLGSYGYCAGSYPNFLEPNVWKLGGSNDNTTWYLVDSVSNGSSGSGDARSFTPAGPSSITAFRYYRWILQALSSGPSCYMGGFFLKDTSGNVITASVIQNNIVSTYHGGGHANFAYWINRTTFGGGSEDVLPNYNTAYTGSNSTTLITDAPPSTPGAPTDLSASAGNQSVSISFSEGSNGGQTITNYKYSLDGGSTFTAFDPVQTTSPVSITGLTNGVSYTIKLKAVNSLGDGAASASITVTPSTIPDAPTDLSASYGGSGAVEISFTAGSDEGATILNYEYSIDGGSTFTAFDPVDTVGPVTITGLSNGVYYAIELRSVNENGSGAASSSVGYFAYGPASPPTDLTWVDTLNGTIRVDFTPGSDQGDAITNYEYSLDGGSTFTTFDPEQSTNYVVISGLNNRTHYSIVLRAINAAGVGSNSAALNMYYMCFLEGTKILCFNPETKEEEYRAIETLRKGSLVKTVADGYKAIDMIGTSKIYNPGNSVRSKNRLYKCPKENYPDLTEDLFITGCHSILVKDITAEERTELMDFQGKIYVTDKHYRLIAAVDKRAEPHASEGVFNIWHMALENENYYFNYGIYANGLLVETTSLRMMKELSGMDLVQ